MEIFRMTVRFIEEADGFDRLEQLQQHPQLEVYEKAYKIVDTYLQDGEDGVVPDSAFGATAASSGYNF